MNQNQRIFYAAQKKVWAITLTIYTILWIISALLFCFFAVMVDWPFFPSIIIILLLSFFIAFFPASIFSLIVSNRIRCSKLKDKKNLSMGEFMLRCDSSAALDTKIAKCFRETLGNNLKIDCEKIYPEDTKYDLLFPLGFFDLKAAVDSLDLYGMMEKAGHPISMKQADEMIPAFSNIETVCEKIKYLSKFKKQ